MPRRSAHREDPRGGHLFAHESAAGYNPFNLLAASRDEAIVAYNFGDRIEVVSLQPGLHLLTNLNLDDFECPKISHSWRSFADLAEDPEFTRDPLAGRERLRALLSDHLIQLDSRIGKANAICVHGDGYGTRSSSLIFLGAERGTAAHFFAAGPPCVTEYAPAILPPGFNFRRAAGAHSGSGRLYRPGGSFRFVRRTWCIRRSEALASAARMKTSGPAANRVRAG